MAVNLITYNQSNVSATDDAIIRDMVIGTKGIITGCAITKTGNNQITVAPGYGIIAGRQLYESGTTITVPLTTSGTLSGRIYYKLDLSNVTNPIELKTERAATLQPLIDSGNVNLTNGQAYLILAEFKVNDIEITNLTTTYKDLSNYNIYNVSLSVANDLVTERLGQLRVEFIADTTLTVSSGGVVTLDHNKGFTSESTYSQVLTISAWPNANIVRTAYDTGNRCRIVMAEPNGTLLSSGTTVKVRGALIGY
jgi:hypothetical protein